MNSSVIKAGTVSPHARMFIYSKEFELELYLERCIFQQQLTMKNRHEICVIQEIPALKTETLRSNHTVALPRDPSSKTFLSFFRIQSSWKISRDTDWISTVSGNEASFNASKAGWTWKGTNLSLKIKSFHVLNRLPSSCFWTNLGGPRGKIYHFLPFQKVKRQMWQKDLDWKDKRSISALSWL